MLRLGELEARIIHTPGHTPGSVCVIAVGFLITGGYVVQRNCRRDDLSRGSRERLGESLASFLGDYAVLPGHGEETGLERGRTPPEALRANRVGKRKKPGWLKQDMGERQRVPQLLIAAQLLIVASFAAIGLMLYALARTTLDPAFRRFVEVLQLSLIAAALALLARAKCYHLVLSFIAGSLVGFAFEILGTRTGIPFGMYKYVWESPNLLGVPVPVIYGWGLFITVSYAAALPAGSAPTRILHASLLTAVLDMAIDPVMVSLGFWSWARAGEWFGIPLENFAGWFVVAAASLLIVELAARAERSCPLIWKYSAFVYLAAYAPFIAASTPATATPVLAAAALGAVLVTAPQLARQVQRATRI